MSQKDVYTSIRYRSNFVDNPKGNKFENIPTDLKDFLHKEDGVMSNIVDNLCGDQVYEITISIKSI